MVDKNSKTLIRSVILKISKIFKYRNIIAEFLDIIIPRKYEKFLLTTLTMIFIYIFIDIILMLLK